MSYGQNGYGGGGGSGGQGGTFSPTASQSQTGGFPFFTPGPGSEDPNLNDFERENNLATDVQGGANWNFTPARSPRTVGGRVSRLSAAPAPETAENHVRPEYAPIPENYPAPNMNRDGALMSAEPTNPPALGEIVLLEAPVAARAVPLEMAADFGPDPSGGISMATVQAVEQTIRRLDSGSVADFYEDARRLAGTYQQRTQAPGRKAA